MWLVFEIEIRKINCTVSLSGNPVCFGKMVDISVESR